MGRADLLQQRTQAYVHLLASPCLRAELPGPRAIVSIHVPDRKILGEFHVFAEVPCIVAQIGVERLRTRLPRPLALRVAAIAPDASSEGDRNQRGQSRQKP